MIYDFVGKNYIVRVEVSRVRIIYYYIVIVYNSTRSSADHMMSLRTVSYVKRFEKN